MLNLYPELSIGHYILVKRIGGGATGEVWQAFDKKNRGDKAIKIYSPGLALDDSMKAFFEEEYNATSEIRHPHIVPCEDMGLIEDRPYLVMPLCSGSLEQELTQRKLMQRRQPGLYESGLFSEKELALIINHVARGLEYIHNIRGSDNRIIIHKDIKPANILILREEFGSRYLLSDFGISKKARKTLVQLAQAVEQGSRSFTLPYAAPEFLEDKMHTGSDIFSLGVMIYELTQGEIPFGHPDMPPAVLIRTGVQVPSIRGDYSKRFKEIISQCLQLHYADRLRASDLVELSNGYLYEGFWPSQRLGETRPVIHPQSSSMSYPKPSVRARIKWKYPIILMMLLACWWFVPGLINTSARKAFDAGKVGVAANSYALSAKINPLRKKAEMIDITQRLTERFTSVSPFLNGIAVAQQKKEVGGAMTLVDSNGRQITELVFSRIVDKPVRGRSGSLYYIVGYDVGGAFYSVAHRRVSEKFCFIDGDGKLVSDFHSDCKRGNPKRQIDPDDLFIENKR